MPIETILSQAPYYSEHNANNNYYRILFRPSVSVQVRELNELQEILQEQIERFGDNVFKKGTIIDGCNFGFYPSYSYVKLLDNDTSGTPAIPSTYVGKFAIDALNDHKAIILDYAEGYESSDPDLNTIYVEYINSGNDYAQTAFIPGRTLTISDANNSIYKVIVNNGGTGFANSDTVICVSAIAVNVTSGTTISNNTYIHNEGIANLQIIEVDTETLADIDQVILRLKPRDVDLANGSTNSLSWSISNGDIISDTGNTFTATVENIIGSGFRGELITTGVGAVDEIDVVNEGKGYETLPTIRIRSVDNANGMSTLSLTAQNYLTKIKVASAVDSIGYGYAFSTTGGIIYQKGYFLRANSQTIVVKKYDQTPNNVVVGFRTSEEIIDSDIDTSLLDNVLETENSLAPGANRLKLTPELVVMNKEDAEANTEFFTLVEWNEGKPVRQYQETAYNKVEQMVATRIAETSGNFVLDQFNVTTRSPANSTYEAEKFSVVVDPGSAYIDGNRIRTESNFVIDVTKTTTSRTKNNEVISLNYGSYIQINEVGGTFQYNTGDTIDLYNQTKRYISNGYFDTTNTTPVGTKIGTARIRSLVHNYGTPGVNNCIYDLHIFDIRMNRSRNFKDVRSVYYNGTYKGIGDIVLSDSFSATGTQYCELKDADLSSLIFPSAGQVKFRNANLTYQSIKNANNIYYTYRTIDQTVAAANSGLIVKSIAASPDEFYPYAGTLTAADLRELYVVPNGGHLISLNLSGTVDVNTTSPNVIGTSTTFIADFDNGDYIYLTPNATANNIRQVKRVVNNTLMILDANVSFANASTNVARAFPKNVPIPFGSRSALHGNVDSNGNILTLAFKHANLDLMTFRGTTSVNTSLGVNIERRNVTPSTKTPNRNKFVKLRLANNAGGTTGPWCIGVPDAFRLRGVYLGTSSSVSNTSTNVTDDFYIDHNQNENYLGLSYLYVERDTALTLTSSDYLLVEFDYFTTSGIGYYTTTSYTTSNLQQLLIVDSQPLSNLTSDIHSLEIPEVFTSDNRYYNLRNSFDFRPYEEATDTPASTSGAATINPPVNTVDAMFGNTASTANEKKFPAPGSTFRTNIEYFLPRRDGIYLSKDGNIFVKRGSSEGDVLDVASIKNERERGNLIKLDELYIPAYPCIPQYGSNTLTEIINQRISNIRHSTRRFNSRTITSQFSDYDIRVNQPKRYTQEDIGNLDRRIKDLEYYQQLTLLESNIKNRNIQSSLDPTLDRFKYGFFVDQFINLLYTDYTSPIHSAILENDDVVPDKFTWVVRAKDKVHDGSSINEVLVQQVYATEHEDPCSINTAANSIINTIAVNYNLNNNEVHTDYFRITDVANSIVNITLTYEFFNNYHGIQVFIGNTTTTNSTSIANIDDSVIVTAADRNRLKGPSNDVPGDRWNVNPHPAYGNLITKAFNAAGNGTHAQYSGKIQWTHLPSLGDTYIIKKLPGSGSWIYTVEYQTNEGSEGFEDCPPANTTPIYFGTMDIDPDVLEHSYIVVEDNGESKGVP